MALIVITRMDDEVSVEGIEVIREHAFEGQVLAFAISRAFVRSHIFFRSGLKSRLDFLLGLFLNI